MILWLLSLIWSLSQSSKMKNMQAEVLRVFLVYRSSSIIFSVVVVIFLNRRSHASFFNVCGLPPHINELHLFVFRDKCAALCSREDGNRREEQTHNLSLLQPTHRTLSLPLEFSSYEMNHLEDECCLLW